jgi:hypothetical protein
MKFRLAIHQAAIVEENLAGKVKLKDLCLLDYLRGWSDCANAMRTQVEGKKFIWISYQHACSELPILFTQSADTRTRINQLSGMIRRLHGLGLIATTRVGRDLYFRLEDLGIRLTGYLPKEGSGVPIRSAPISAQREYPLTESCDGTLTRSSDDIVTQTGDGAAPCIMDETGTTKPKHNQTPPVSPSGGEIESIVAF